MTEEMHDPATASKSTNNYLTVIMVTAGEPGEPMDDAHGDSELKHSRAHLKSMCVISETKNDSYRFTCLLFTVNKLHHRLQELAFQPEEACGGNVKLFFTPDKHSE